LLNEVIAEFFEEICLSFENKNEINYSNDILPDDSNIGFSAENDKFSEGVFKSADNGEHERIVRAQLAQLLLSDKRYDERMLAKIADFNK